MRGGKKGYTSNFPLEMRWAVLGVLLTSNDKEVLGKCYKLLTNQSAGNKIVTNHILAILYDVCDQRTLKKRGLAK